MRWENIGMGVAVAADWFDVGGENKWVDFMSTCEGRGKRRTWHVTANHYPKDNAQNGKGTRVMITKRECFRYEAAREAFEELCKWITNENAAA